MTVSSTTSKVSYSGNGSTVAFTVTFYFLASAHLKVVVRSSTGTETVKTLGTHYTVTGAGDPSGGTVTMLTAPASGETLVISRNVPLTQVTDYQANDPFPAETHEQALDKLTQITQQVQEELTRAIKLSVSNTMTSTEFTVGASSRANKVLGFDSAGELAVTQEIGTYRGNWAGSTAYQQRDIIKDTSNANIYICVTAHTSSGSQPISSNTDSAKWALLVDAESATDAKDAAEAAQAAAETAQAAAELAETNAETAETNAETAETNAETAATNASNSASAAATSATNASNSATAAATSATNASNSATAAATSATAAQTAETNAETAEANAETAQAAAETAETNAETAATNAANSASAASTSATNAANSATAAATSATNASNSATASANSATAAANSATSAATLYDNFDDRYLGAKSSAPSVDNDGNALLTGALYFNTVDNAMKVWNGTVWLDAYASLSGALIATNNLSDLTNTTDARNNLGLGDMAVKDDVAISDIDATGTASSSTFLRGDGAWQTPPAGFSGANDRAASSSDITLTASDAQTQVIRLTSTGLSVTLPDATTLTTEGTPVFYFVNLGNAFTLKNASGGAIGFVTGSSCMTITLADNSTSAGKWQLSTNSVFKGLVVDSTPTSLSFSSDIKKPGNQPFGSMYSQPNKGRICVLSPTTMILFYTYQFNQNSRGVISQVFTIASNGITAGSTQDHVINSTSGSNYYGSQYYAGSGDLSLIRLTDTTFAFTFAGYFAFYTSPYSSTTRAHFRTYTGSVSGSTITLGSPSTFTNDGATGGYESSIVGCRLTDTKYLIGFSTNQGTNAVNFYVCTDNGGSVSVGSGATLPSMASSGSFYNSYVPLQNSALALTDSLVIVSDYTYGASLWVLQISGSTITAGAKQTNIALGQFKFRVSNTEFVSVSSTQIRKHSVSGTTISTVSTVPLTQTISEFSEAYGLFASYDSTNDKIFLRNQFIDINTGSTGFVSNFSVLNPSTGTTASTAGGLLESGTASKFLALSQGGEPVQSSSAFTVTVPNGF